ncbi:hypothetical protein F0562_003243 [Nyssa sinensis]|uniref:Trehalose 6-phosphate phosphatase n=1 Tax=Nyssa sinensis TaxID=561372 RepID=A0A5J5BUN9_9ASTE|nr:hypothetical protein F0562_003243 [Nyssa sinensis]
MPKQNLVVSDTKSAINMAITVAMSNPCLFAAAAQKPPAVLGGYFTISRKKLLQNLDINGGARINSVVDSMRSSSPTHIKSNPPASDQDQSSWILHHPSALDMFEQITNASKGKQIVMFLDYDGTLSPIVDDPDRAFMSDQMRATVRKLARHFPTATVSGRCRDKVYSFVRLAEFYYAGSHGMDIKGLSKGSKYEKGTQAVLFQPANEFLPMIDKVYKALVEKTKSNPGGNVENNKFCISVHFRCVDEKKLLQNLDINGGARINSVVDSMRSSSTTHIKSNPPASDQDQSSWILHHPSALDMFEQITNASKGKQIVMFLDYDGTLSPIVDDPDRAFMSNQMRATVRKLARHFPTAIVSGRCRDKVYSFVRLAELYYAGSHGLDIKGPLKGSKYEKGTQAVLFQPANEFLPMIDEVYKALVEKTKSTPGANVENNKFCISVHFRCVDEKKWSELAQQVKSVLKEYPKLRLTRGRKVLEIRPSIKWDKGKALEFLLESLGYANCTDVFPVYIGDDRTDEDAFKVLRDRGQGFGILVSKIPKETNASYSLQEPV